MTENNGQLVTKEEALAFLRLELKRCQVNIASAKDRGDKRAVVRLEQKSCVYQYLMDTVVNSSPTDKSLRECPSCGKLSVDVFGYCYNCDQLW